MTTNVDYFNKKECEKIDAQCVDAEFELAFDLSEPNKLILFNSWNDTSIDMTPIVKHSETVTHLKISPTDNPVFLDYQNETGDHECIAGEDLAKIIPLKKLHDVSQNTTWSDGYAPVWDATANKFVARYVSSEGGVDERVTALEAAVQILQNTLANTQSALTSLTTTVNTLSSRVAALEALTAKPEGVDEDATLAWGNVNLYTKTDKSTGAYVHDPSTAVTGDRTINSDVS